MNSSTDNSSSFSKSTSSKYAPQTYRQPRHHTTYFSKGKPSSHASSYILSSMTDPTTLSFLTQHEKEELVSLKCELDNIEFPVRPPGAFMLFKEMAQKSKKDKKGYSYAHSTKEFCQTLKRDYDSLKEEERSM
jgi:hypothetical protein